MQRHTAASGGPECDLWRVTCGVVAPHALELASTTSSDQVEGSEMSTSSQPRLAGSEASGSVAGRLGAVRPRFGQRISGLVVNGRDLRAPVFNEVEVRAAAGLTMVIGAVAFSYAYFDHLFLPLKIVTSFFFADFLIRVAVGLQYSPVGLVSRAMTRKRAPEWVSAKPKRFAWTLGLMMAGAMTGITNVNIHGWLPRSMCLVCLTLMWMESALGLCLGCQIYGFMVRRGLRGRDAEIEVCAGGVCELPRARPLERAGLPTETA
jgi:hypothetical protein